MGWWERHVNIWCKVCAECVREHNWHSRHLCDIAVTRHDPRLTPNAEVSRFHCVAQPLQVTAKPKKKSSGFVQDSFTHTESFLNGINRRRKKKEKEGMALCMHERVTPVSAFQRRMLIMCKHITEVRTFGFTSTVWMLNLVTWRGWTLHGHLLL